MGSRRRLTLIATIVGSSLAFVDATVVIVALPTIHHDLGLGLGGQQWVFLSYSLALAALYLPAGAVGDRYGRRATFLAGAAGFAAASALAGAAPDQAVLLAARTLQGVAGAFLTTSSLALLRAAYGDEAGRAIGLWTAFTSVATLAGPPLGGALAQWASWRWIFFVNLPLAAVALACAHLGGSDDRRPARVGRLDLPGAGLAALGFGALTYGLVEGAERGFAGRWWAFVVAAAALGAFALVERRASQPLLPFELFRRRNFAVANGVTFLAYGALYGTLVYLTIYVQFLGLTPFQAGLVGMPVSIVLIALSTRVGAIADRRGPRLFLVAGPAAMGCGALLLLLVSERSEFWVFGLAGLLVFSLGLAALVAPITSTALKAAPAEQAGIAAGVNSTVSRLGSLLSVATIGLVISLVFHARVDAPGAVPLAAEQAGAALRSASAAAFHAGMLLAAALAFAAALLAALGISDREARGEAAIPETPAPAGS